MHRIEILLQRGILDGMNAITNAHSDKFRFVLDSFMYQLDVNCKKDLVKLRSLTEEVHRDLVARAESINKTVEDWKAEKEGNWKDI